MKVMGRILGWVMLIGTILCSVSFICVKNLFPTILGMWLALMLGIVFVGLALMLITEEYY